MGKNSLDMNIVISESFHKYQRKLMNKLLMPTYAYQFDITPKF